MAYSVDHSVAVAIPIAVVDTGKTVASGSTKPTIPLGTIIRGVDPTYGQGEFIFLQGVGSTAVGDVVTFDGTTYQTVRATTATNQGKPIAVAMAAVATTANWGWYQIEGTAVVNKSTAVKISNRAKIGMKSTAKVGSWAPLSGKALWGAVAAASAASAVTTIAVVMNRPHLAGLINT